MAAIRTTAGERALEAGRALLAEGQSATGSAIRERAGVAMATAVEAARTLRAEMAAAAAAPEPEPVEVPEAVIAAAEGVWRAAMVEARAAFALDREAYAARLRAEEAAHAETREERDDLLGFSGEQEMTRERLEQEVRELRIKVAGLEETAKRRPRTAKPRPAGEISAQVEKEIREGLKP